MKARQGVTSLALVALALGALAYAYLVDRRRPSDADRVERPGRVFPRLDVLDVRSIVLERAGERLALEREGDGGGAGGWTMTSPSVEAADPAAVDALLLDLGVAARLRAVSLDPVAAGLASPRVRGQIHLGAADYAFALGGPASVPEGAAYLRVEGEGVFVVDRLLAEDLLRGADAYRDRVLVPYGLSETAKIEVRGPGTGWVLVRAGESLEVDGTLRASRKAVDGIFAALADAHADAFLHGRGEDGDAGAGGLSVTLEPTSPARPTVTLRFGEACPTRAQDVVVEVSAPSPRWACVPKAVADALSVARDAVIDAGVFRARADEMAEVRLESIETPDAAATATPAVLDLARRGSGWHERSPEDHDVVGREADAANGLAERLASLASKSLRPSPRGASFPARSRATVVGVDGATEVVDIAAPDGDGSVRVRRVDDGAILTLAKDALRDLEARSLPRSIAE